jgi:hypothetical protein
MSISERRMVRGDRVIARQKRSRKARDVHAPRNSSACVVSERRRVGTPRAGDCLAASSEDENFNTQRKEKEKKGSFEPRTTSLLSNQMLLFPKNRFLMTYAPYAKIGRSHFPESQPIGSSLSDSRSRQKRAGVGTRPAAMTREAAYGSIAGDVAVVDIASTSASDPGTTARPATSRHARRGVSWTFLASACACRGGRGARLGASRRPGSRARPRPPSPPRGRSRSDRAEEEAVAVLGAAYGRCDDAADASCPALDLSLGPFGDKDALAAGDPNARAHLFILGDSIDKLIHVSACNALLAERERCAFECSTPAPRQYPRNTAPFLSGASETNARETCCRETDQDSSSSVSCCASEFEFRTAFACRPRTYAAGAGDAGFLMLMGSSPEGPYFEPEDWRTGAAENPYVAYGLPSATSARVDEALLAFLNWTQDTRAVTALVSPNIVWELFRWGVEPGFDPGAFRESLESTSGEEGELASADVDDPASAAARVRAYEASTRALVERTRARLAGKRPRKQRGVRHPAHAAASGVISRRRERRAAHRPGARPERRRATRRGGDGRGTLRRGARLRVALPGRRGV